MPNANETPNPAPDGAPSRPGTSLFSARIWLRRGRARGRRLFLRYGLPWGGALAVGLVAVLYARWSEDAYELFLNWIEGRVWLAFLITPLMTMIAVYMTRRWFSGSEGSGIPQVIAALHAPPDETLMSRLFGWRVIIGKLGLSLIGFLGGLTIGREGPTVHLGAAIMAETRRFYPHQGRHLERSLLLAGAAAGLSGAFNTPLAGVIFAIEELARDFESRTNGVMITAVVFSGLTSLALAGNYLYFGQIVVPNDFHLGFIAPVLVASILCGLSGAAFNWTLLRWEFWMPAALRELRAHKPVVYALLIGLAVAALGVLTHGQTWGSGYDQARKLLEGKSEVSIFFALTKWLAMVISYMSGMPGGLFSPSLSIGAGLAQWVHAVFGSVPMPALIALCMAGYLAAVTQSPLTSFVIVMEMTNGTGLMIPMMAVALASARISNVFTPPLYEALAQKNYFGSGAPTGKGGERAGR
ncbi:MAG: chloride channel protein [Burkholderiales bacterium]|nr:chloride channel protein [Burkholderiales bacterium]